MILSWKSVNRSEYAAFSTVDKNINLYLIFQIITIFKLALTIPVPVEFITL